MANKKKIDDVIDVDEIDELPDVVLGEETRAIRAVREGAHTKKALTSSKKSTTKTSKKLDKVDVYEQTTGIPSVDELLANADSIDQTTELSRTAKRNTIKEKQTKVSDTQPIEISETSSKTTVVLDTNSTPVIDEIPEIIEKPKKTKSTKKAQLVKVESKKITPKKVVQPKKEEVEETKVIETVNQVENDLDLDSIKQQKYKNGTRVDYLGNEVEIEDFNTKTQRYRIFDAGRTKWVTEKNLKLFDPEIPDSLQDEDPGVKDELTPVLEPKKEKLKEVKVEETKPLQKQQVNKEVKQLVQEEKPKQIKDPFATTEVEKKEINPFEENVEKESTTIKNEPSFKDDDSFMENYSNQITNELNEIYSKKAFESTQASKVVTQPIRDTKSSKKVKNAKKSKTSMFLKADSEKDLENTATDQPLLIAQHDTQPIPLFDDVKNNDGTDTQLTFQQKKTLNKKRKNYVPMKQKIVTGIIIILLILLGVGVYTIYNGTQPVSSTSEEVAFEVKDGATARSVADDLYEQDIIKNADVAYTYARLFNLTDVKQGLFTLDKSWDIKQMWTYLNDQNAAKKDETLVTIIEGDWAKDAANKFAEVTNVSSDELLALWNNQDWINSQREEYPFITDDMFKDGVRIYLEGYLAPNTYYVNKETTAEEITTTLLNQTLIVYNKYKDDIATSGHTIAEIYTMASIIQYEAGTNPDDLAKVASVFYNRLNAGMALQSSVTVCYAIDFDKLEDNWQACEVNSEFESPYNTYKYTGLTPGPIENAGEEAIYAAIHPADTNYYYFMAEVCDGQDGTVHYAETLDEHNANVSQYLTCY